MREKLIEVYLDWRNNYVTVETYADHHGLNVDQAQKLIDLAKDIYNSNHPES